MKTATDNKKTPPSMIDGLSDIADNYDCFILDIFGVVHDGIAPYPGTLHTLNSLLEAGKEICLLSNSPLRAASAVRQMEYIGINPRLFQHAVTSGEATHHALKAREDTFHQACGNDCWLWGPERLHSVLNGLDIRLLPSLQGASFILNAIPDISPPSVKKLRGAMIEAAQDDIPMICANPDLVVNIGNEPHICAGTFAKEYEELGGRVFYHGKPHEPVYELCYELLGKPDKSRIVAVGDSLRTDIDGANRFGIDSALNLPGIHWHEVTADSAAKKPDRQKLSALIDGQHARPQYVMNSLDW